LLEELRAVRFVKQMKSGKTGPCLLGAERKDGSEVEVVVKFSSACERGIGALACEALAAMLAADLDLPIPEPFCVRMEPGFIAAFPFVARDIVEKIRASSSLAFGSAFLPPGYSLAGTSIARSLIEQAADIFAFDCLIANPDRGVANPNCLSNGKSYAIFDHELAFFTKGMIGWQPPWKVGALERDAQRHLFYNGLKGKGLRFERLEGAWRTIGDDRISEYKSALPVEWLAPGSAALDALAYIAEIKEWVDQSLSEVARVLQ
jgi:hypothetical protein